MGRVKEHLINSYKGGCIMDILTMVNTKLGGKIPQLNMPSVFCRISSCRDNPPCAGNICYCHKGNMAIPNVRESHAKKMELYLENPQAFFDKIYAEMSMANYKFFRYFSSGDIVDEQMFGLMCKLARKCKETRFLCFTKKYEIVNEYLNNHVKPSNLVVVLSSCGEWIPPNPHNLPTSWIAFGDERDNFIPQNANECPGSCGECVNTSEHCWRMRKGESVYFHKH